MSLLRVASALFSLSLAACAGASEPRTAILRPAAFELTVRGMTISLASDGTVRAPDCAADLDFATATLTPRSGGVWMRLSGDGWPRTLVTDGAVLPIEIDETHVYSPDHSLFSLEGGRLMDAGAASGTPADVGAAGLDEDELTTALALLALVGGCWESPRADLVEPHGP